MFIKICVHLVVSDEVRTGAEISSLFFSCPSMLEHTWGIVHMGSGKAQVKKFCWDDWPVNTNSALLFTHFGD